MRGPDEAPPGTLDRLCRPALFAPSLATSGLLLSLWFMNGGLPPNDEGALLTNAAKILQGGVFYRDIDAYPFPAAPYVLALAMRGFGEHLSVARGLAALVFEIVLLALYAASLHLLSRPRAALFGLTLLVFKFLAWPAFTAYTYSDRPSPALRRRRRTAGASGARGRAGSRWRRRGGGRSPRKQNLGLPLAARSRRCARPGIAGGPARIRGRCAIGAAAARRLLLPAARTSPSRA
jgi:hypothetical protein